MAIFDVVTPSGKVVSSIIAGSEEAIYVGKAYGSDYISTISEYIGEEVSIKLRNEIDYHKNNNKMVE